MKQLFKAFFVAVAVALLCAVLAVCAFAEVYTGNCGAEGDNVTYSLDTETGVLTITGSGEMADYDYDGTPWNEQKNVIKTVVISNGITSIGDRLFNYCFALESISIPDSITRIGDSAFFSCSSLKQVIIPTGVTEIPHQAFTYCNSITEVFLHSKIENIGSRAFAACDKLVSIDVDEQNTNYCDVDGVVFTKDMQAIIAYPAGIDAMHYDIPESVVEILDSAFEGCLFESVGIPNSVVYIDWWAFMGCTELVSIQIPESVAYLGSDAFHDCSKLKTIDVDESNEKYCDIDGVVFTKDKKTLIRYPEGGSEIYEIPNGVICIGESAFGSCDGLESVTLPESLKEIGVNAFNNCSNITDITIPNGVMFIRACAFWWCNELKSITIPNSVKFIGDDIFYSCDNLESIKIYRNSYADAYFSEEDYIKVYLEDSTITSNGDFEYRINDDEESVTITWYNGDAEDVVISSEIDGYS
ncbi:MAG: leucine-rich repeat domain-containing protein, partial [Clostridia bacterium]|nr:leucine-rich repeat domain-containing protein [Clostridia bacterium]